jgi:dTDP-4-dehydrorhamnose reductase
VPRANRRLLITGGSGYLGRHLVRLAAAVYPGEFRYTTYTSDPNGLPQGIRLNIHDGEAVGRVVRDFAPDAIIHTIGSNRPVDMTEVIVEGTRHVTMAAMSGLIRLIHISTDAVFDGTAAPYDENASPSPINEYGRAKADAEDLVRRLGDHVIVRTSLIYGLEEMDNGTAWMAAALQAGQPVTLFTNQRRNPVWITTLCKASLELIDHPYQGVLNVAGRQVLTRADFGLRLLDWWGMTSRESLVFGPDASGRWPLDCELDVGLAGRLLATPLSGVDEVIASAQAGRLDSLKESA